MSKPKTASYYVEGRIGICVGVEIMAKSLEEAQERAKTMTLADFIEVLGDHNDSNFAVTGVFKAGGAPEV